jgi:hypothetical protein
MAEYLVARYNTAPTMMFSACFWFLTVTSVIETAGNRMSRAAFKTHHGDAGKNQGHRVIGKGKPFAADYADECRSKNPTTDFY